MPKIALFSTKGGSGKSTLAVSLASYFHLKGKPSAVVDCDPQETSYDWKQDQHPTSKLAKLPVLVPEASKEIPEAVKLLEASYEWLFLDVQGSDGDFSRQGAKCADLLLIPMRASGPDLRSFKKTYKAAKETGIPFVVVINQLKKGSSAGREASALLRKNGVRVLHSVVHNYIEYERTHGFGETPSSQGDYSHAAGDIRLLANELMAIVKEGV